MIRHFEQPNARNSNQNSVTMGKLAPCFSFFFMMMTYGFNILWPYQSAFAQTPTKHLSLCLFDSLYPSAKLYAVEPKFQKLLNTHQLIPLKRDQETFNTIPVVVHIIHNGGAENISKTQIERQIAILNEDFGKLPGTPGEGKGVDTRVRFCLAKLDPFGRCTDGIVRLNTPLTNHQPADRSALKNLSFWNPARYLNIYVVRTISGQVGGYASFPYAPPDEDGVVVRHDLFGDSGTAAASGGRTLTHEVGHWLGLYHTFNAGCGQDTCTGGDFVCDTPPVAAPNYSCNLNGNSCSNDLPDLPDQVRNYMDYTPDDCKNMFTPGQKNRIAATLKGVRSLIVSASNLAVTGCDSAYVRPLMCPVAADFITLTAQVCPGTKVYFMDRSLNTATSWQWSFPGGTPAFSILPNPTVTYANPGSFSAELIASNGNSTDTLQLNNYIQVSKPQIGLPLPFMINFDDGAFPAQGIRVNNPDFKLSWGLDTLAAHSLPYSVSIDNLRNLNYGTRDELVLPALDLSSSRVGNNLMLNFWWAYARSDPNYSDQLVVQISKDCGANYSNVWSKSGDDLATGPTQTTPFIPNSTQWSKASVRLFQYKTEQHLQIRFVNVTDGGNRLYLDDIQINDGIATATREPQNLNLPLELIPNPAQERVFVHGKENWSEPIYCKVYDGFGRLLRDYGRLTTPVLDLIGLPAGLLLVRFESTGRIATFRLIKGN